MRVSSNVCHAPKASGSCDVSRSVAWIISARFNGNIRHGTPLDSVAALATSFISVHENSREGEAGEVVRVVSAVFAVGWGRGN